jgi:glycosyltransferase involved in cell wall biosynthesis
VNTTALSGNVGSPLLSVVVPAFNERGTIVELLRRVVAVPIDKEVIVIDDCSTDNTARLVEEFAASHPVVRLLRQTQNSGKGAAVRRGIAEARGDVVLIQDADLEYEPSEYPRLIEPILSGDADVVYGSRFAGHPRRVMMYWHTLGNSFLTWLSNVTTNLNLTDMETCYKVFRRSVIQSIRIKSARFGFEPEVTAKIARRGYRIYEVPISYHGRDYWEGKKINWKDGVSAVWTILKYGLFTRGDSEPSGYVTLERMASLRNYNRWIWDALAPYAGQRILEVGSGTGNMTRLLYGRELIVATDTETAYLDILRNRFLRNPTIVVEPLNLDSETECVRLRHYEFDTVVCLNVLEHIRDDAHALRCLYDLLIPGGHLLLFVPADQRLYGSIDKTVGHYRRYSSDVLQSLFKDAGFEVAQARYQNSVGRFGWWLNGRVLKRENVPANQSKIFDRFVPLLRAIEGNDPKNGLSLVVVGRKPLAATQQHAAEATVEERLP